MAQISRTFWYTEVLKSILNLSIYMASFFLVLFTYLVFFLEIDFQLSFLNV